jgi:hypothetical protein
MVAGDPLTESAPIRDERPTAIDGGVLMFIIAGLGHFLVEFTSRPSVQEAANYSVLYGISMHISGIQNPHGLDAS